MITELQEKILQHALRDLGIEERPVHVQVVETKKERSPMSASIHRWVQMHEAEKGL